MNPPIADATLDKVESLFHSIARYTRFVRSTKVMLAVLATALTAAVLIYPRIQNDSGVRVAFTSIEKSSPTSPTQMLNARFHGLDKDNQPFNISAKTATQIDENQVGLDKVTSDITLKNNAWFSVSGNSGLFLMKEKELDLKGSIEMFDDGGYEFRTELMHVDVGKRTATTHEEVQGQGPLGLLKAYGGAHVDGASKVITFQGPVFVTVYPAHNDDSKPIQDTEQ